MIKIILLSVVCFAALSYIQCRPQREKPVEEVIPILRSVLDIDEDGSYMFGYEGGDLTSRSETGKVIKISENETTLEVTGQYRYVDPETKIEYEVTYKADHNGFVPMIKEIQGGK